MLTPRQGVVTLFGFGIKARLDRATYSGGWIGLPAEARFPRVGTAFAFSRIG